MNSTMQAARYLGPNRIETCVVSVPELRAGEALLKVRACGFCGSDIGIVSGVHPRAKAPLTIGHELAASVAEIGPEVDNALRNRYVTVFPLISCGHCSACTSGNAHVCRTLRLYGFDAEGGMAEFVRVPVENLIPLPELMPPEIGALIEPLAVAVHAVRRVSLTGGAKTAVLGAGPIGLLTALTARSFGLNVGISDPDETRFRLGQELGFARLEGNDYELIFECAGAAPAALEMTALLRPRGTIVNVSVFKKAPVVDLQAVNFKELTIVGSRVYTKGDFAEAIQLAPNLPLGKLITNRFPLAEAAEAYARFVSGGDVCKVIVQP